MKFIRKYHCDTNPESKVIKIKDFDNLFLITAEDIYKDKDVFFLCGYAISILMIPKEFGCYDHGKLIVYNTLQHTKLWSSIAPSLSSRNSKIIFY
jgi:hypothetical protein